MNEVLAQAARTNGASLGTQTKPGWFTSFVSEMWEAVLNALRKFGFKIPKTTHASSLGSMTVEEFVQLVRGELTQGQPLTNATSQEILDFLLGNSTTLNIQNSILSGKEATESVTMENWYGVDPVVMKNKLFRGDDAYEGGPLGYPIGSAEAQAADIQNPYDHVMNKKTGDTSIYTSYSVMQKTKQGGGDVKFTKKGKIWKVDIAALQQLELEGKIRILTPDMVFEMLNNSTDQNHVKQAKNVKANMERNGEVLIEGQVPANLIQLVN